MRWHIIENSKIKFQTPVQKLLLQTINTETEVSGGMDFTSNILEFIVVWKGKRDTWMPRDQQRHTNH